MYHTIGRTSNLWKSPLRCVSVASSVLLTGAVGQQGSELVSEHKMLFSVVQVGDSGERSAVLQWIEVCAPLLITVSACSLRTLLLLSLPALSAHFFCCLYLLSPHTSSAARPYRVLTQLCTLCADVRVHQVRHKNWTQQSESGTRGTFSSMALKSHPAPRASVEPTRALPPVPKVLP